MPTPFRSLTRTILPLLVLLGSCAHAAPANDWTWTDEVVVARKTKDGFEAEFPFIPGSAEGVIALQFPCSCTIYSFKVKTDKSAARPILQVVLKEELAKGQTKEFKFVAFPKASGGSKPKVLEIILADSAE